MKEFRLFAKDGDKISLTIGNVSYNGTTFKVEIEELKKKSNILFEKVVATIGYMENKVVLIFKSEPRNKLLDITKNKNLIDYIWKESGATDKINTELYYYTTEGISNFAD